MIRPEIVDWVSPDLLGDPAADSSRTAVDALVEMEISVGGEGTDLFSVRVVTPDAVRALVERKGVLWGRGLMVVGKVCVDGVVSALENEVRCCARMTRHDALGALRSRFFWEYDE